MIQAVFQKSGGSYKSFSVTGHAEYDDEGSDIVCAGVSSAVMLICNAVTEVYKLPAGVIVGDNEISLTLEDDEGGRLIESLALHLNTLSENYPENISVKISEV